MRLRQETQIKMQAKKSEGRKIVSTVDVSYLFWQNVPTCRLSFLKFNIKYFHT